MAQEPGSAVSSCQFLSRLHALLAVLDSTARRKVIMQWLTDAQRKDLEHWMLEQQGVAAARPACRALASCDENLDVQAMQNFTAGITRTFHMHKSRARREIVRSGNGFLASVYVEWLEIRCPLQHKAEGALNDHRMLIAIKSAIRQFGMAEVSWEALAGIIKQHGHQPSHVKAHVMIPAEFWIGTRLATPHQTLGACLSTWYRLKNLPMWTWWKSLVGDAQGSLARATAAELWAELREEYILAAVTAGYPRCRIELRMQLLESKHRHSQGSLEDMVLDNMKQLLDQEHRRTLTLQKKLKKEMCAYKRKLNAEQKSRASILRRRMQAEKDMTMEEILAGHGQNESTEQQQAALCWDPGITFQDATSHE
eukprot:gb/GFBE01049537.1/.p1 GENE.gb/GFBE01049537.1/~~gb/GFBE01049537.1/.p1  ORF type:complete len:367 (+),score=71.45 gb/GFBE01049537.1/:1-1101(+)